MVKIRQPANRKPKYVEAFRDGPRVYPSLAIVRPGAPLILVEGELDALLLGQELGERAAVVTLGSASAASGPGRALDVPRRPADLRRSRRRPGRRPRRDLIGPPRRSAPGLPNPTRIGPTSTVAGRERIRGFWNALG